MQPYSRKYANFIVLDISFVFSVMQWIWKDNSPYIRYTEIVELWKLLVRSRCGFPRDRSPESLPPPSLMPCQSLIEWLDRYSQTVCWTVWYPCGECTPRGGSGRRSRCPQRSGRFLLTRTFWGLLVDPAKFRPDNKAKRSRGTREMSQNLLFWGCSDGSFSEGGSPPYWIECRNQKIPPTSLWGVSSERPAPPVPSPSYTTRRSCFQSSEAWPSSVRNVARLQARSREVHTWPGC